MGCVKDKDDMKEEEDAKKWMCIISHKIFEVAVDHTGLQDI